MKTTPMIEAASHWHPEICQERLAAGAILNGSIEGKPVQLAEMYGHVEVTTWLMGRDAEPGRGELRSSCPLHSAYQ